MSFTTAKVLFTPPVTQITSGVAPWSTPDAVTVDDTSSSGYQIYDMGTGDKSHVLNLTKPKMLGAVPPNGTVSNITIDYSCVRGYGVDNIDAMLQIGTGPIFTGQWSGVSYATQSQSRSIASWGLSNAEVMQFIAGSIPFKFWAVATANGPLAYQANFVRWIKVQMTWDLPAGESIYHPQVF